MNVDWNKFIDKRDQLLREGHSDSDANFKAAKHLIETHEYGSNLDTIQRLEEALEEAISEGVGSSLQGGKLIAVAGEALGILKTFPKVEKFAELAAYPGATVFKDK